MVDSDVFGKHFGWAGQQARDWLQERVPDEDEDLGDLP
jgi:hypothetical protein